MSDSSLRVIAIEPWIVEGDPKRTAHVYRMAKRWLPNDCSCQECLNFQQLGERAYPDEFRRVMGNLGVDTHKAAEIYGTRVKGNVHYGGWFHCVGKLLGEPQGRLETSARDTRLALRTLGKDFSFYLIEAATLAFREFGNEPLVQIEFESTLPWVLSRKS